jgi:hypothetical protein
LISAPPTVVSVDDELVEQDFPWNKTSVGLKLNEELNEELAKKNKEIAEEKRVSAEIKERAERDSGLAREQQLETDRRLEALQKENADLKEYQQRPQRKVEDYVPPKPPNDPPLTFGQYLTGIFFTFLAVVLLGIYGDC